MLYFTFKIDKLVNFISISRQQDVDASRFIQEVFISGRKLI
jgi:hypothetical protein